MKILRILFLISFLLPAVNFYLTADERKANKEDSDDENDSHQNLLTLEELTKELRNLRNPYISQLPPPEVPKPPVNVEQTGTQSNPPGAYQTPPTPAAMMPSDYLRQSQRLPMDPSGTASSGFDLTGIVWNSSRPQAIINGQVLSIGDKVNEYVVKAIKKTGVVLKSKSLEKSMTIKIAQ